MDDLPAQAERFPRDFFPLVHPEHGVRPLRHGVRGWHDAILDVFWRDPAGEGRRKGEES